MLSSVLFIAISHSGRACIRYFVVSIYNYIYLNSWLVFGFVGSQSVLFTCGFVCPGGGPIPRALPM